MVTIKNAVRAIQVALENAGKARALASLRGLDRRWLEQQGFSLEALDRGIDAWPWRQAEKPQSIAATELATTESQRLAPAHSREPAGDCDQKTAA